MKATETVSLHYETIGEGPPVMLLHGLYGSGSNWKRYARWLSASWRVLLPDLRNHGRSPEAASMDYRAMAGDLVALLDAESVERAVILGHSLGGKAAMALALIAPQRLSALVVADIAPVAYNERNDQSEIIAALQAVDLAAVGSRADADKQLAATVPEAMVRQFLLTNLQRRDDGWAWRIPLQRLADELPRIQDFPEFETSWNGPALFVHGGRSNYVDKRGRKAIAQHFPSAEIVELPDAGHFLHIDSPEAFGEALSGFLERAVAR